jgi:hypothetical protein
MNDKIADDVLRGVKAIAREVGLTERQVYYKLEQKHLPAGKDGEVWIASRQTLREHYRKITAGEAA